MRILVTHPGRQHSHQLAHALHERNQLAEYWTGVPAADPATKGALYKLLARLSPQPTLDLPGEEVRHNVVMPLVRRVAGTVFDAPRATDWRHRAAAWFDIWAARRLPADLDVVVCYENGARETFRAAKEQGATTILDAASFHYTWQDAFYEPVETDAVHRRINARKDDEVELADHILTVSELARQSYIDAGVPPEQVTSVPMGTDLSAFTPRDGTRDISSTPFTFLFAGHAGRRKGVDVLLAASERLARQGASHRLEFAGGTDDGLFDDTSAPVERLGYLSTPDLAEAFRRADVLVLPSRHDSFGRVVVEALATGLPVLVSEHVGAKEVIDEGETGWVVPADDVEALSEQMRWCIEHPEQVREMHDACLDTAQDYSWEAYRERVAGVIGSVFREPMRRRK
ncbi:glycosyltransferase family 4 protein [Salinibacter ruber]|uniref:glycosyltransferase family 4 protein n=1 Tax=Salinibacter ruber TaxID=146919 RepID=UPI002167F6C4|nr:glycosyltransferase family 4 protein [Salinibacter ruber]MCS4185179.1 glycosyltransferase involved in cell wall biosynthesis [Salinibacter ruber]